MNGFIATSAATERPPRLLAWHHTLIFLAALAILISRRPDALFHAQFYAEDGHVWFADAYNLGWWRALFYAQDGYFQTLPRLAAALALLVPMARAPLVTNLIALAVQAVPVNLMLSTQSSSWGSPSFRACLALCYLALPNSTEIALGITESQWLLALIAFLLLVSDPPRSKAGRWIELLVLTLSGVTGPFCIFLLPLAIYLVRTLGGSRRRTNTIVMAVSALLQAFSLLVLDAHVRPHDTLGANPAMFARILGGNVFLGAVLGRTRLAIMPGPGVFLLLLSAVLAGLAIAALCFWKSSLPMRLFLILTAMLLAASMLSPSAYPPAGTTVWQLLANACGGRYWFYPSLAFAWSLLYCVRRLSDAGKIVPGLFLGVMLFSIVLDWREPAVPPSHFNQYVESFQAAPPGSAMVIQENPPGWTIRLVKHSSD